MVRQGVTAVVGEKRITPGKRGWLAAVVVVGVSETETEREGEEADKRGRDCVSVRTSSAYRSVQAKLVVDCRSAADSAGGRG